MMILHRCDNPPCVRPDHLFLGDAGDNARDRVQKGRFIHLNRGENSGRAKLSETQALDIIADKRSAKILAGEYGVRPDTITAIKRGASWRHLQIGLGKS